MNDSKQFDDKQIMAFGRLVADLFDNRAEGAKMIADAVEAVLLAIPNEYIEEEEY